METIVYIAPSSSASIEKQIAAAKAAGFAEERFLRIDRPEKKGGPVPRAERDFVFDHMLRSAVQNSGHADTLWIWSFDALADNRRDVMCLAATLHQLGVPLIIEEVGLRPDLSGMEHTILFAKALATAESRWKRAAGKGKPRRKGATGRRVALTEAQQAEALAMKDNGATWPEIVKALAERGIAVSPATLRNYDRARRNAHF